jgi:hypothetical protein
MSCLNQIIANRVAKHLPRDVEVLVEPFDYGHALGIAIRKGERRHAVRAIIRDGDLTTAADEAALALSEYVSDPKSAWHD